MNAFLSLESQQNEQKACIVNFKSRFSPIFIDYCTIVCTVQYKAHFVNTKNKEQSSVNYTEKNVQSNVKIECFLLMRFVCMKKKKKKNPYTERVAENSRQLPIKLSKLFDPSRFGFYTP